MTRPCKPQAFTLIELLVVISIIGLLASLLIPSLNKARALARRATCKTNLHDVGVGLRMYLNDSNDVMPVVAQLPSANLNAFPSIATVLAPHLASPETLKCPADSVKKYYESEGSSYEFRSTLGGNKVAHDFLTKSLGESKSPVMYDYEPFHGPAGKVGSANYLFSDMHVGDLE